MAAADAVERVAPLLFYSRYPAPIGRPRLPPNAALTTGRRQGMTIKRSVAVMLCVSMSVAELLLCGSVTRVTPIDAFSSGG